MSDVIRLLPDSVANQIAAGEVIQRPASVVKELVENAIDAEAKHIHVLITDAGKTCIQVVDDGKGMSETDARLSFERHATSKIREAADLFALHTMGFRGEALASIAAVAQVELKTRREIDELGTLIHISGSRVERQETVSCPKGCNFSVNNLFFNVPARRKFLKSNQTELSNILNEFERIVLVHPDVAFTLQHNDTELYNLPVASLRQRLLDVFGKKLNQQLLNLEVETSLVKITGFVSKPEFARKKGAHQFFFVNNRYMRHPYFHKAVMEAYTRLIPVGEQISYFIYFDVAPADIDINIHPTKTEIKFENDQAIWQILVAAIKETLGKFNAVPTIDFDTEGKPDIPVFTGSDAAVMPQAVYDSSYNPFYSGETDGYAGGPSDFSTGSRQAPYRPSSGYRERVVPEDWEALYRGTEPEQSVRADSFEPLAGLGETGEEAALLEVSAEKSVHHYQFKGRYILTSVKSGLMIIEQTRAHIRILFDRYLSQIEKHQGASQGLLFPEMIEFPSSEAVILESLDNELTAIGFELSNLGGGSYAINSVPSDIGDVDPVTLLRNLVHSAHGYRDHVKKEMHEALALVMAKAAAVAPGQLLSKEEMDSLISSLFACQTPNYTPDGKTILTILKDEEIDSLF